MSSQRLVSLFGMRQTGLSISKNFGIQYLFSVAHLHFSLLPLCGSMAFLF